MNLERVLKRGLITGLTSLLLITCGDDSSPTSISQKQSSTQISQKNNPPVISSSPLTQIDENSYYEYQIQAQDPDGDLVNYRIEGPSWLSVTHNIIFGTSPEVSQDKIYSVKLIVADGENARAEQSWNLLVKNSYNVNVLSQNQINQLSSVNENSLSFTNPVSFSQGDIIVAGINNNTPKGILREITNISQDKRTIQTKQGTLEKVLKNNSFSIRQTLSPSTAKTTEFSEGVFKNASSASAFSYDLKKVILEDRNKEIFLDGNISFNLDYILDAEFKTPGKFLFKIVSDESVDLKLTSTARYYILPNEKTIARLDLGAYTFVLPPPAPPVPIVVTPKLDVVVGIKSTLMGSLETRVLQKANFSPAIIYENGWRTSREFSNSFEFSNSLVKEDLKSEIYAGMSLNILFYEGFPGPKGAVNSGLKFEAASPISWKLYGNFWMTLGVDMGIFSSVIPDYAYPVISFEKILNEMGSTGQEITTTIQPGPEGKDAYVSVNYYANGNVSYEGEDNERLEVSKLSGIWDYESFIQFPLSSIPSGASITSAKLYLYGVGSLYNEPVKVNVKKVLENWNESIKWNNKPDYDNKNITSVTLTNYNGWHEFDVTPLVEEWVKGVSNYGMALTASYKRPSNDGAFRSSDNPDTSKRPRLVVSHK
ncbi:MAG: DNRLRE domain-containing protein [Nanoarchaeota archaeon]|nr:DNRLRE domain-containing protein [Nanoarchaeota archaeon]